MWNFLKHPNPSSDRGNGSFGLVFNDIEAHRKDDIIIAYVLDLDSFLILDNNQADKPSSRISGTDSVGILMFLKILTGKDAEDATKALQVHRVNFERDSNVADRMVLLVLPCFSDVKGEQQALEVGQRWLKVSYPDDYVKIRAFLYLHSITDPPPPSSPMATADRYHDICGDASFKRVKLVLTNSNNPGEASGGLKGDVPERLAKFWKILTDKGSGTYIIRDDEDGEGIGRILEEAIRHGTEAEHDVLDGDLERLEKRLKGKGTDGKEIWGILSSSLKLLVTSRGEGEQEVAEGYTKARDRIGRLLPLIRDNLRIRDVGERFTGFFLRKTSQFLQQAYSKCLYTYRRAILSLPIGIIKPQHIDFFPSSGKALPSTQRLIALSHTGGELGSDGEAQQTQT